MFMVSQRSLHGEQSCHVSVPTPGSASQTTSEQPSCSLLRIAVEQNQFLNVFIWSLLLSWLLWGWWESGRNESCWDIWLFIFFALSVFTLHQFSWIQNFTFENRGRRRHAERGRILRCCVGRGEKRHHTVPRCYWVPCQSTPLFPRSPTWPFPPQQDDGAGTSKRKLILSILTFSENTSYFCLKSALGFHG